MKKNYISAIAIALACSQSLALTFSSIAAIGIYQPTAIAEEVPLPEQVQEVVSHLVGVMATSAQAQSTPKAPDVRMTTCTVKVIDGSAEFEAEAINSVFLYQEQALSKNLTQPYRQRFLEIKPLGEQKQVASIAFKPPTPATWTGLCQQPEEKRILHFNDLGTASCRVFLERQSDSNEYVGETPPEGCPIDYRGAVKVTNRIILHQTGMDTWDRGFDAEGNQVWGAKEEPYQYRWLNNLPSSP
jgi:hypothetical protein